MAHPWPDQQSYGSPRQVVFGQPSSPRLERKATEHPLQCLAPEAVHGAESPERCSCRTTAVAPRAGDMTARRMGGHGWARTPGERSP